MPAPRRSPLSFVRACGVRTLLPWLVIGSLAAALAPEASGHARSASYSRWEIDERGATITLRLKRLELTRFGPEALPPETPSDSSSAPGADASARALPRLLVLLADGEPCAVPQRAQRRPDEVGWVRYRWQVHCPADARSLVIRSRILLDVAPSHLHFARVRLPGASGPIREQVLTEAGPEMVIRSVDPETDAPSGGSRLVDYLLLGVEHILTGWDHLAFVFGLLLLASRLGEVARLVTGFTVAHSLTLALAVLDWVDPREAAVEAVIAFSVSLVAVEKSWLLSGRPRAIPAAVIGLLIALAGAAVLGLSSLPLLSLLGLILFGVCYFALAEESRSDWLRTSLTFAFGLVHGLGFAGVLVEMALPNERLVPALLGFNLGVELGQIGVVLLLWPLIHLAKRLASSSLTAWAAELSAASLCGLGLYWLVERAL